MALQGAAQIVRVVERELAGEAQRPVFPRNREFAHLNAAAGIAPFLNRLLRRFFALQQSLERSPVVDAAAKDERRNVRAERAA